MLNLDLIKKLGNINYLITHLSEEGKVIHHYLTNDPHAIAGEYFAEHTVKDTPTIKLAVFIGELSNGESYLKKDGKYVVEAMLFSDENRVFYPNWNTKEIITIKLEGDKHNVLNKDGTIDKSFNTPQEAKAYITSIL